MNAQQAKELADEIHEIEDGLTYQSIIEAVKKAAAKGDYEIYFSKAISLSVLTKIKEVGYDIENMSRDGDYSFTISWK